jgi:hypothetical protein
MMLVAVSLLLVIGCYDEIPLIIKSDDDDPPQQRNWALELGESAVLSSSSMSTPPPKMPTLKNVLRRTDILKGINQVTLDGQKYIMMYTKEALDGAYGPHSHSYLFEINRLDDGTYKSANRAIREFHFYDEPTINLDKGFERRIRVYEKATKSDLYLKSRSANEMAKIKAGDKWAIERATRSTPSRWLERPLRPPGLLRSASSARSSDLSSASSVTAPRSSF